MAIYRIPKPRFTDDALRSLLFINRQLLAMSASGQDITLAHPELVGFMVWAKAMDHPAVRERVFARREKRRAAAHRTRTEHLRRQVTGEAPPFTREESIRNALACVDKHASRAPRLTKERIESICRLGDLLTYWGDKWTEHPNIYPGWRYAAQLAAHLRQNRELSGPITPNWAADPNVPPQTPAPTPAMRTAPPAAPTSAAPAQTWQAGAGTQAQAPAAPRVANPSGFGFGNFAPQDLDYDGGEDL